MEIAVLFLIMSIVLVVPAYFTIDSFAILVKCAFFGYKRILITPQKGKTVLTITKDGKTALYSASMPLVGGWVLTPEGKAGFKTLSFYHATWKYI